MSIVKLASKRQTASLKRNKPQNLEGIAKRHIKYKDYILKRNLKRTGLVGGAALVVGGAAAYLHHKHKVGASLQSKEYKNGKEGLK